MKGNASTSIAEIQCAIAPDLAESNMLSVRHVTKEFPGVKALDAVSFNVRPGEVHGLIGENGAGKSTLMAVASGALTPTDGEVWIHGVATIGNPEKARDLGLAIVRQEPALMPDLSVAENIYLGVPKHLRPPVSRLQEYAREVLASWNADLSFRPTDMVISLNPEQRFQVEIAKALASKPMVLVLDEPTEHLSAGDVARLFTCINEVTARGASVVYISHRIREVRQIASRVTVLRDGKGQGTYEMSTLDEGRIVELIVGNAIGNPFPQKSLGSDASCIVDVSDFSGTGFRDVSLSVRRGEIVGLAGIDANGQREFLRALAGRNKGLGQVSIRGEPISVKTASKAKASGIGFLPGDRHREGILATLSVRENFSIRSIERDSSGGLVNERSERLRSRGAVDTYAVKTPSLETPIAFLSGGNQQKLILASVVAAKPDLLLIDEPTQGIDVGARSEIYKILREIAEQGTAIVVVSSDAAEIAGLCDTVLVFSRGQVVRRLEADEVSESNITQAVLTSTLERTRGERRIHGFTKWASGQWAPIALVGLAILLIGAYASMVSPFYLSTRTFSGMLALVAILSLVAYGQQFVLLVGEIDLSIGPLMGLCVVIASFFLTEDAGVGGIAVGLLAMLAVAVLVGAVNFFLSEKLGLHSMVATLATFIAVQAMSLALRPQPDGLIGTPILDTLGASISFVPLAFVVSTAVGIMLDNWLLRRPSGIALRGFGSRRESARTAGISPVRSRLAAYVLCSLFGGLAAIPLLAQVGIGDPTIGVNYTLASVAAVVIGGGSLAGGRGSFIGAILGAVLLNQINVVATFLHLSDAWTFYLQGAMILLGVALYSRSRQLAAAH